MYAVIDLETTIKESFKRKANPFDPANRIVALGLKRADEPEPRLYYKEVMQNATGASWRWCSPAITTLVGHNIKFDLLYLWKHEYFQEWLKNGGKIWDTQLAEYILTGQQETMCALRKIAVNKYGCPEREKRMEAFWNQGICTSEIPKEIVLEDLKYDLLDTEAILKAQVKRAKELGMFELIRLQMDALLATTEMEFNGMYVDQYILQQERQIQLDKLEQKRTELLEIIRPRWEVPIEFNLESKDHLSALFFGGNFLIPEKQQQGYFKNGNPKMKLVDVQYHQTGLATSKLKYAEATSKNDVYKVDEKILDKLVTDYGIGRICKALLEYRALSKDVGTYYDGIQGLIHPQDSCIHHNLHHMVTKTGRLSSSNPNQQNIPSKEISNVKKAFRSRFKDGVIVEIDYSQLEVAVQAFLAQDENMIEDIKNGIDFHCKRLAYKEHISYDEVVSRVKQDPVWAAKRKAIKGVSFAKQYGAGIPKICAMTGLSGEEVKEILRIEDELYPKVKLFNDVQIQKVKHNRRPSNRLTLKGRKACISQLSGITGRLYTFIEDDAPKFLEEKGTYTTFKPTEIKNYPVQGLATGDIVPIMVGKLYRALEIEYRDRVCMINTVHDSIMLDVKDEQVAEQIKPGIIAILENVSGMMKQHFNIDFNVPLRVEYKVAKNWREC
jgi:DNA polymerase-1